MRAEKCTASFTQKVFAVYAEGDFNAARPRTFAHAAISLCQCEPTSPGLFGAPSHDRTAVEHCIATDGRLVHRIIIAWHLVSGTSVIAGT